MRVGSNRKYPTGDAKSPPTITVLGGSDRIVPKEQAMMLDQALAAAGATHETYVLPGADHGLPTSRVPP